jgi:thiol-disulfide isomerase/thioredoxin
MSRHGMRLFSFVCLAALALGPGSASLPAQAGASLGTPRLKTLYFQRQYDVVVTESRKLLDPDPEAQAWTAMAIAKAGRELEGLAAAETLVAARPDNGWSWIALASVRQTQGDHVEEAIKASDRAIALMPDHPNAVIVRANALAQDAKRRDEALALIESKRAALGNPAQLLVAKAYVLYVQGSGRVPDEAKLKAAFDTFGEARNADPTNVDSRYLAGTYLSGLRRNTEAFPLLAEAAKIAPNSTPIQQAYWRAINADTTATAEARLARLQSLIETFVANNSERSSALYAASSMYKDLKLTAKQLELENTILTKYLDTIDAEWVLAYRWRDLASKVAGVSNSPEYRKTLVMFLERPHYFHDGLLGEAYRNLFFELVADKSTKPEYLQRTIDGMLKYETTNVHIVHALVPVTLADNKVLLDTAEKIARGSIDVLIKKVDSQREFYKDEGEYDTAKKSMVALGYDALGWVLQAEDRPKEAEKELLRSYDLNHENRGNLFHLGKLYENTKDLAKAEEFYVKGLGVSGLGTNASEAALKSLFEANKTRTGATGTFDEYLAGLRETDRVRRRTAVMGERAAEPKAAPAFNLKTLDGKMVSLDSLKGKVVAINFWGIWCGWCVHELPDYQKLYEQYKNDPDVVILTIDNDQNPNDVPPWMTQKKFSFPVLYDDGFVAKAGIQAFPTTWFLDRDGRLAFTKVGWSEKLVEEFGWRIEAIRK